MLCYRTQIQSLFVYITLLQVICKFIRNYCKANTENHWVYNTLYWFPDLVHCEVTVYNHLQFFSVTLVHFSNHP